MIGAEEMTSKIRMQQSGKRRKYTILGSKESGISKMNQEALRFLKRLRGKLG